ncbi:MAG TPA: amidohydrolase family protein [Conexivisphaerales archaeon]|nr:amidohydrolase family protein [Conexivisphaerales archaeon]
MTRAIDAHIHLSERKGDALIPYAQGHGLRYDLEELLSLMDGNDIEAGMLLSPPMLDNTIVDNERILALCRRSRGKLHPVLTVEPSRAQVRESLSLARKRKGEVKGFKVRLGYVPFYPDDPVFSPLYDYAESEDLPVMFHTGDTGISNASLKHAHPLNLDALANVRESLKIVACHMGNPWIEDAAELVYKHRNVYADLSGLFAVGAKYSREYVEYVADRVSKAIFFAGRADKFLFGTDYPVETYDMALSFVRRLKLYEDDFDRILYSNAKEVFPV